MANSVDLDTFCEPFCNILFVSSKRAVLKNQMDENLNVRPHELDHILEQLDQIEWCEQNGLLDPNLPNLTVAHIANIKETKMKSADEHC